MQWTTTNPRQTNLWQVLVFNLPIAPLRKGKNTYIYMWAVMLSYIKPINHQTV